MLASLLAIALALAAPAQDDPERELQAVRDKIADWQRNTRRDTRRARLPVGQLRDAEENVKDARAGAWAMCASASPRVTPG